MNKKTIITALFALVTMTGHGQVHYRLEGNIGDSTITGKAVVRDHSRNLRLQGGRRPRRICHPQYIAKINEQ